jgi:hypothetical protein
MRSSVLFVLLGIAIAVNGCGGSTNGGGTGGAGTTGGAGVGGQGGGSAGTAGGGATGTGGAPACSDATGPNSGATCNVVEAGGACVTATFSTAAAPAPAGGTFAGGTFNLVSQTFYGSAADEMNFRPGVPFRQTSVLSHVTSTSFTLDQVWTTGTVAARARETAAVSGMTATFTQTCPAPDAGADLSGTAEFTATSSSITLFQPTTPPTNTIVVSVFNKAP